MAEDRSPHHGVRTASGPTRYDAIVLAGGSGRRLGGVDKAALDVGSRTLLDRTLDAVVGATRIVAVGPTRDLPRGVDGVLEDPPGSGPVAAIAAAVPLIDSAIVIVLACDMPLVTASTVDELATHLGQVTLSPVVATPGAATTPDVALLVDEGGRRQYLAGAYRTDALRAALQAVGPPQGLSMRQLVGSLTIADVPATSEVTLDCDTWADVERVREILEDP